MELLPLRVLPNTMRACRTAEESHADLSGVRRSPLAAAVHQGVDLQGVPRHTPSPRVSRCAARDRHACHAQQQAQQSSDRVHAAQARHQPPRLPRAACPLPQGRAEGLRPTAAPGAPRRVGPQLLPTVGPRHAVRRPSSRRGMHQPANHRHRAHCRPSTQGRRDPRIGEDLRTCRPAGLASR